MRLKKLELQGFKSFAKKSEFVFDSQITAIVGPNGSGKSNVVEALSFALGEQSMKSMRGKSGADLIWNGSKEIPKMSRASVRAVFDNTDRVFHFYNDENKKVKVDFDEIVISREVFSDGTSTYKLNNSEMRLRDIQEIISSVNLGASGHHIVSQGEADKYLNASLRERKEMIEEALGLRHYHFRISESERKLEKSKNNLREAEILRREIAPHLKFLTKQVKKHEEAGEIRKNLLDRYAAYILIERGSIESELKEVAEKEKNLSEEKEKLVIDIEKKKTDLKKFESEKNGDEVSKIEKELTSLVEKKNELSRRLGQIDGMLEVMNGGNGESNEESISLTAFKEFSGDVIPTLDEIIEDQKMGREALNSKLLSIKQKIQNLLKSSGAKSRENKQLVELQNEYKELEKKVKAIKDEETRLREKIQKIRSENQDKFEGIRALEKEIFEMERRFDSVKNDLDNTKNLSYSLSQRKGRIEEEEREAYALLGKHVIEEKISQLKNSSLSNIPDTEKERREIERMKIKLEDLGAGNSAEIMDEYKEIQERDEFLEKEIGDLKESILSAEKMIGELETELEKRFVDGLKKVNDQFQEFFSSIFGGGKAKINVVKIPIRKFSEEGEEDKEEKVKEEIGIDIVVSVPRKTIRDINMLSGGERSLTSIAILFALSAVEPPPFLVLDETDATLDEVNSRKYGEMLKKLGELSQLILVTHNRETMSCADTLYGIVFGHDDASQILSVKLEEAVQIAK